MKKNQIEDQIDMMKGHRGVLYGVVFLCIFLSLTIAANDFTEKGFLYFAIIFLFCINKLNTYISNLEKTKNEESV